MASRKTLALAAIVLSSLAGCGSSDTLTSAMVGSYGRDDPDPTGHVQRLHLHITPTGMTVTAPSMGASQGITVGGAPVLGGSVKIGASGSALFKKVQCSDETSCRFTTESGCEGTFTRDATGSIVIVATGPCESWSGRWTPEKAGDPATTAAPSASTAAPTATPSTIPAPQVPVATATASTVPTAQPSTQPSGTATASPTASPSGVPTSMPTAFNVSCLAKCNDASMTCTRQCKVAEIDCMKACSDTALQCAKACP